MAIALVVGCAANVWDDVKAARELTDFDAIYCVKQAGVVWPGLFDVWITLHPEYMDSYERDRLALGLPGGYEIVAPLSSEVGAHGAKGNIARRVTYRWPGMTGSASSGIYGAKVALDDGFDKVVLAGIPMDPDAGHFMPETKNVDHEIRGNIWKKRDSFIPGLEIAMKHLRGRVRSMSGALIKELPNKTRIEWLQKPTSDWLKSF